MSESGDVVVDTARDLSPQDVTSSARSFEKPELQRGSSFMPAAQLLFELKRIGVNSTDHLTILRALNIGDIETLASTPASAFIDVSVFKNVSIEP